MQVVYQEVGTARHPICLPDATEPVLPGIQWGDALDFFTPAFWAGRAKAYQLLGRYGDFRTGRSLVDEYLHCVLGGHGMCAELGWAAAELIRREQIIDADPAPQELQALLMRPLTIGQRRVRYRFPRRKAAQVSAGLPRVRALEGTRLPDRELRSELLGVPGVGLKTASWIVRNHRGSDAVAIIDIHIARAGRAAGIFSQQLAPERNYLEMEVRFLGFAEAIGVRAAVLDHVIWNVMRKIGWILDRRCDSR